MAWRMKGTYLGACQCNGICPCPFDGKPTSDTGECLGHTVFAIEEGNLDDTDLGGVTAAIFIYLPQNFTSGNVKLQLVVDESASEEQAKALERIFTGQEGGMFGEFVPLVAEFAPTERAKVSLSDGTTPSAQIGSTKVPFEPYVGADGNPSTVVNAPFAFAQVAIVGKSSGTAKGAFGSFPQKYGESADFDYSDSAGAEAPKGRI